MNISNTDRIVPSGLSVFGWHTRPDSDGLVTVHVDVGFGTGKFGGRPGDLIEFELTLKRAQLVVICGGGAKPKYSTMAREPISEESFSQRKMRSTTGQAAAGAKASLGIKPSLSIDADASAQATFSNEFEQELKGVLTEFFVQHERSFDGHPAWQISRRDGAQLSGNPWDPNESPRLKVEMPAGSLVDEPTIRVEIRCKGEDLNFGEGIRIKDAQRRNSFLKISNNKKNLAAAEQYLKQVLEKEGLSLASPGEKFGDVTLADIILTLE